MSEGDAVRNVKRARVADLHEHVEDDGKCHACAAGLRKEGKDHISDFHRASSLNKDVFCNLKDITKAIKMQGKAIKFTKNHHFGAATAILREGKVRIP